jgi:hypothetical protein
MRNQEGWKLKNPGFPIFLVQQNKGGTFQLRNVSIIETFENQKNEGAFPIIERLATDAQTDSQIHLGRLAWLVYLHFQPLAVNCLTLASHVHRTAQSASGAGRRTTASSRRFCRVQALQHVPAAQLFSGSLIINKQAAGRRVVFQDGDVFVHYKNRQWHGIE